MNDTINEVTLARERLHWGIFIPPLLLLVLLLLVTLPGLFLVHLMSNVMNQLNPQPGKPTGGLFFLIIFLPELLVGLPLLLVTWAAYLKSEITLTNRRLIFRTGLVMRVAGELPLENVEAMIIVEPLLGRVFGFGTLIVTSIGGLRFPLRYIGSPQDFHATLQRAVNDAKRPVQPVRTVSTPPQDDDSHYMPKT